MNEFTIQPGEIKSAGTRRICEVDGFLLTETWIEEGDDIGIRYFNIRDPEGKVIGADYNTVDVPIKILGLLNKFKQ